MPTKQSRELYLLERFLPALMMEQSYTLSQPEPPLPDALIKVEGKTIGIEITALILDEKSRQREAIQGAIISRAQGIFETQHHIPLHVSISFNESANWNKLERNQIALFLTETVALCLPEISHMAQSNSQFVIRRNRLLHSYIRSVDILYSSKLTIPCWSPITSFMVPNAPADAIQQIIKRKSNNVGGYMMGCDEVWLLLLETGSPSSYYDEFEKLQEITFTSAFAKTFIGRIPTGELLVLPTKPQL